MVLLLLVYKSFSCILNMLYQTGFADSFPRLTCLAGLLMMCLDKQNLFFILINCIWSCFNYNQYGHFFLWPKKSLSIRFALCGISSQCSGQDSELSRCGQIKKKKKKSALSILFPTLNNIPLLIFISQSHAHLSNNAVG